MGQKVNPIGIRLGITRDWTSKWYASKKQFPLLVHTDFRVREFLKKRLADASVSRILIERAAKKVNITIQTARPGIVIGKKGEDIEKLRQATAKLLFVVGSDLAALPGLLGAELLEALLDGLNCFFDALHV